MKKIKAEEIVLSNSFEELTEECLFATQGACGGFVAMKGMTNYRAYGPENWPKY